MLPLSLPAALQAPSGRASGETAGTEYPTYFVRNIKIKKKEGIVRGAFHLKIKKKRRLLRSEGLRSTCLLRRSMSSLLKAPAGETSLTSYGVVDIA
jgi:hypothetical protein